MQDPGLVTLAALVVGGSAFLLTLISTDAAMVFLIASMLLSPEISLGAVQPARAVVLRLDDFLLAVVFLTWLAKLAINKQLGVLRSTPLNVPLGLFLMSCLISTGWGAINGSVKNPTASFFYFLKYFEYFFLFFMVANVVRERRQITLLLKAMLAVAVIVCLFAYWQVVAHGTTFRVTAPFEGSHPEPNTLAGYLLLMMGVSAGLALHAQSAARRVVLLGLIAVMAFPFIFTYSRSGYAAMIIAYVALCALSRRYKVLLVACLLLGILMAPSALPHAVFERIADTFDPHGLVQVGRFRLSQSPAERLLTWQLVFNQWKAHPFLGFGITGVGLVDSQYFLVLGEQGLMGMAIFLWIRWRLLSISSRQYKTLSDPLAQGLSLGFAIGLVGLLVHSLAANIFIIVRVMEPFWFLAAIIMVLPQSLATAAGQPGMRTT